MADQGSSADVLVKMILDTPGVLEELKKNPQDTLNKLAVQAKETAPDHRVLEQDRWIYRVVVIVLGFIALAVVVGIILMTVSTIGGERSVVIPDTLTALGSAALGALSGLLAPSPLRR